MYPNWDFWYENKTSGNPGFEKNTKTKISESPVNAARHK
jgi:hypothetical protein